MNTKNQFAQIRKISLTLLMIFGVLFSSFKPGFYSNVHAQANSCNEGELQLVSLDGVNLELCLPFTADHSSVAENTDWVQSGSWIKVNPHQEFSIYAIPYGIAPAADNLPVSSPGISDLYRQSASDLYKNDAILVIDEPSISVFDITVKGTSYLLPDQNSITIDGQRLITEWIAEAGNRVWIIRSILYGDFNDPLSRQAALDMLKGILLDSQTLGNPSTSLEQHSIVPDVHADGANLDAFGDLPTPSWWNGDCDVNNFPGSFALGGIYRGVKACGPLNTLHLVNFGAGVSQYEWQCAELPKRYLFLLYSIAPKSADGINVVNVYDNALPNLKKVANGTPNSGLAAGDIISYNGPTAAGHTAIVSSVSIDGNGNGSYTTIEQNSSATGVRTNTISNWWLNSNSGISVYLHDSNGSVLNPPNLQSPNAGQTLTNRSVHFTWQSPNAINQNGYTFRLSTNSSPDTQPWIFDRGLGNEYTSYDYTLPTDGTFYWHMRTWNTSNQASNWVTRSFVVNTTVTCLPVSGVVRLFDGTNCSGSYVDAQLGLSQLEQSSFNFNDRAESIAIPSGWSARLYLHNSESSASACFTSTDTNLGDNTFSDGTNMANQATWVRVYNNSSCAADTTPPSVSWIQPVGDGQVYDVFNQTIQLEVNASDNVGISKVVFYRWDYVNLKNVEIGTIFSSPYRINFDTSTLLPDWNEIDAFAYDAAGNSASKYIWLNHVMMLTVNKAGTGSGTVTASGINCGSDCSESYPYNTSVTLTATASTGSTFAGWSGDADCSDGQVTMNVNKSCTATFNINSYTLTINKAGTGSGTVTSNPTGVNCGSDCSESYVYNTTVALTATATTGSAFIGWSGGGCSGTGTCTVAMTAATSVTANFNLQTSYTLSVNKTGTGSGTVTSNPSGINCGLTCSYTFSPNTIVTLTATPATGSVFTGWSGGGCSGTGTCTVVMTAATSVTANFTLSSYNLTVNKNGASSGTVTSNPTGINCGSTCSYTFTYNTSVTLTANANVGSTFTGWSGGGCSGTGTCTVIMVAATTVTASFGDTTPPTLSWIAPVGDAQVYDVSNQTIRLEVNATDNGGISRVDFYRWDYVNLVLVSIGTVVSSPYSINFDTNALLPEWNEIEAYAYDNAGNLTTKYIWLNHVNSTNTGLLNPASNVAQATGDKNGYEVNPINAYANDSIFAVDNNSGTGTSTSCTDKKKDGHLFYDYGINLPGTATIQGIEVSLDAKVDSTSGSPKLCVLLSWDGGRSWTAVKSTGTLGTAEQTFILGSPTDTWGHAWTASQLSNANFRVRVIDVSSSTSSDFSLDWIAVRVTYK